LLPQSTPRRSSTLAPEQGADRLPGISGPSLCLVCCRAQRALGGAAAPRAVQSVDEAADPLAMRRQRAGPGEGRLPLRRAGDPLIKGRRPRTSLAALPHPLPHPLHALPIGPAGGLAALAGAVALGGRPPLRAGCHTRRRLAGRALGRYRRRRPAEPLWSTPSALVSRSTRRTSPWVRLWCAAEARGVSVYSGQGAAVLCSPASGCGIPWVPGSAGGRRGLWPKSAASGQLAIPLPFPLPHSVQLVRATGVAARAAAPTSCVNPEPAS
jgi:hypothetical protein